MFDILYNKTSKPIVTNELLDDFEAFKDLFNQSSLSAEALAEEIGGVDDRIVNYAKTCKNGEMTTRGFSSSLEGMTLKAKAGQVALKGLSLVGNALAGIAVSFVVTSVIKGIDYLINREEKLKESLSDSIEVFESTTSEIKSLDEQVKTLGENIAELQKLKDAGTISIADDEELQKLKEENDELERQIALLQDKQIREGKQVLKDAEKQEDDYVQSRYSLGNKVTPAEELWLGTQSYIYAINSNNDALAKEHGDRVVDMYEKIQPTLEAYRSLEEAGYTLSESEKEHFDELKKGEDAYLMYVYLTNSTKEAFVALNQEMQKSVMLRHLVMEKGMTEEQAGFVLNNIDPEDYENLYGTEFAPSALTDYATAEEYGKAYAEAWLSGIEENVQGSTSDNEITVFSTESFNKEIKSYEDNYKRLIQVQEEWNETQALAPSTFVELQESGLLEYLEYTADGLVVNSEKLLENAQACKDKAVADLHAAMMQDILGVAIGDTNKVSEIGQSVIAQLGNNAEISGNQALSAVEGWASLGEVINTTLAEAGMNYLSDDKRKQISAIYDYYKDLADNIKEIDITSSTNSSGSGGGSSAKKEYEELFDFFERRIKVLNDSIDLLKSNLENVNGSFAKNKLIDGQSSIYQEQIRNYTDALSMYQREADKILATLPADISEKIKNGLVDLTTFMGESSEAIVDAMKDYEGWSDSIHTCQLAIAELEKELESLELSKFTNIMDDFNNQFDIRENSKDLLDKQIDLFKEAGLLVGTSLYDAQLSQSKKQLELLEQEKAKLVEQMNSALASGRVKYALCALTAQATISVKD